jgi:formiminotetrahydrofolate cyclodeaminase
MMEPDLRTVQKVLDPQDNTTGGGSASAIAGAMAGALVAMVARLSMGKAEVKPDSHYREIDADAQEVSRLLFTGASEDSAAFEAVRNAHRLPRQTEEQKASRRVAIQTAWVAAARVPLNNAEQCVEVLKLASRLIDCYNLNAASDLKCAVLLARAAVQGCAANVEINVPAITDSELADELLQRARVLVDTARQFDPATVS